MNSRRYPLLQAESFSISSHSTGLEYRIVVGLPLSYAATTHAYPVLYVLDGDSYTGTVSEIARGRSLNFDVHEVIVVGVCCPSDTELNTFSARRAFEFSTGKWDFDASEPGREMKRYFAAANQLLRLGGLPAFWSSSPKNCTPLLPVGTGSIPRIAVCGATRPEGTLLFRRSCAGPTRSHTMRP